MTVYIAVFLIQRVTKCWMIKGVDHREPQ